MADASLQIVDDLITLVDSHDTEMTMLEKISEIAQSWKDMLDLTNDQIKENVRALTRERDMEHEKLEAALAADCPDLSKLKEQEEAAEQHQHEVARQVEQLTTKLEECQADAEELSKQHEKVKEETTQDLASLRYLVSLYSHISNIRWQYDDVDDDDIRGYVCNKKDVKPFQLSSKQNSRHFIINYLWDLMDTK